jgi:4-hydroxy-3-polyprenylbenzoate decarboxylase
MSVRVDKRVAVAVTGASGSVYAEALIQFLLEQIDRVYLIVTESGRAVIEHEVSRKTEPDRFCLRRALTGEWTENERLKLRSFQCNDLFAPIASGSSCPTDMVVVPCSMGTMARIANGTSSNLLERAADVVLKERRNLVICPRETPLNAIHLENMLKLARLGVQIVPAMPAFYQKPKTIEDMVSFVVGRLVECLGLDHQLYRKWNNRLV